MLHLPKKIRVKNLTDEKVKVGLDRIVTKLFNADVLSYKILNTYFWGMLKTLSVYMLIT